MILSRPGQRPIWRSTKIPHDAPNPKLRAELKRQAEAIYAQAQAQITLALKGLTPRPTITVEAHLRWYLEHHTAHKRGARREQEIVKRLIAELGALTLAHLTRDRVLEWRTARRGTVSASTVNREMDVLKASLHAAVPAYLESSPLEKLARLRGVGVSTSVLSHADEGKLLAELKPADQALVIMGLDTLMRLGDILKLRTQDDHGAYLTVADPKSGHAYKVPVSTRLRTVLNALTPDSDGYYFPHRRKAKPAYWKNQVKQMLKRACTRAGVKYGRGKGITFHSLRHTGATRMIQAGVDLRTLQEIGGWSSLRMLTRYLHPTEKAKRAAVEWIGRSR